MIQTIDLSVTPGLFQPTLYYSQGDIGREFKINLADITLTGSETITMQATKPSGLGFTVTGTISGNSVSFTSTEGMTDEAGRFPAELHIVSGNTEIGTANFMMVGEEDPHPDSVTDGNAEEIVSEITLLVERAEAAASTAAADAVTAADAKVNEILNNLPTEVSNLKADMKGNLSLGTLVADRYIKTADGTEGYSVNWSCSDYVEVNAGETLTIYTSVRDGAYNAFYQSDKTFISAFSLESGFNKVTAPSNARFLRLSNTTTAMQTGTFIVSNVGKLKTDIEEVQKDSILRTLALENEYYDVVRLTWEIGSVVTPNGINKNPDDNVIRTPLPRLQFNGDIRFVLLNDKYKIRLFEFPDTTSAVSSDSGWYRFAGTYSFTISKSKYYRIQITTDTASSMNMDEALKSILIVYADDTTSEIAPFWDDYIESKVQTINSYMRDGADKTAFLFLTDTHWNESMGQLNAYGVNAPLMQYVKDRCNIDYLIHGGDLNSEYRSNKNLAKQMMTKPMAKMRSVFGNVLVTRGNHDDNNEGSYKNWNYTITQADSYSYMFRNTKDVVFGETGTYFYHDIPFEKVRIISLDCVDFPYTNDVDEDYLDEKLLAYGYTQLQWFCDVLKNTPSEYHIVIYTHAMIASSIVTIDHPNDSPQTRASNRGAVARILQAYKNREYLYLDITGWFEAVHQSYYDGVLDGDFTNCDATIVGVFSGHEHVDCIEEIEVDDTGIGIYNTCTQNSSAMFDDSVISHTYQHPMEIGTTSELVWDMVVIDRENKHVDMIRIGANGANTDIEEVNVRSFDYE